MYTYHHRLTETKTSVQSPYILIIFVVCKRFKNVYLLKKYALTTLTYPLGKPLEYHLSECGETLLRMFQVSWECKKIY